MLYREGWRPQRTIKLISWDAEEYGLIGSTEYVEQFPDLLSNTTIAYINVRPVPFLSAIVCRASP